MHISNVILQRTIMGFFIKILYLYRSCMQFSLIFCCLFLQFFQINAIFCHFNLYCRHFGFFALFFYLVSFTRISNINLYFVLVFLFEGFNVFLLFVPILRIEIIIFVCMLQMLLFFCLLVGLLTYLSLYISPYMKTYT